MAWQIGKLGGDVWRTGTLPLYTLSDNSRALVRDLATLDDDGTKASNNSSYRDFIVPFLPYA